MEYVASKERYNTDMRYRRCGNSGILLSELSLGLWHNFGDTSLYSNSKEILHCAFDNGITHFDLANNYGPPYGSAEQTFGRVMKESFNSYRHELFITTKAGYDMWDGPYGNWGSRKYLITSLEHSLKRMNLDYVDLFYSHRYDPNTPLEETMQALVDIVRSGKALYVAISRYPYHAAEKALRYLKEHDTPAPAYQGRCNIFDRGMYDDNIFSLLESEGVGSTIFSPLAQGVLTDRYLKEIPSDSRIARGGHLKKDVITDEVLAKVSALNIMAERRGESLAQMSLRWLLSKKHITSVIIGASTVAQLKNNLQSIGGDGFSSEELTKIDAICGIG